MSRGRKWGSMKLIGKMGRFSGCMEWGEGDM